MAIAGPSDPKAWWQAPALSVRLAFGSGESGLTAADAEKRLAEHGPNLFRGAKRRPLLLQFLARFRNPLVLILLAASLLSALTGDVTGFVIIGIMVLSSVSLDFFQEHRASRAAEALRRSVGLRATVLRDGREESIEAEKLVPGDLVHVSAGDLVPADTRVIEARDFFLRQALFTGEPYPVEKHATDTPSGEDEISSNNTALSGTSVISGSARLLVCRTGNDTIIGSIQGSLAAEPPPTSVELGTRRFGMLIARMTVLLVLFVLLVNAAFGRPWMDSFLFAVALAVGLTPELLPMIVSVTLANGAQRLAAQGVVVKRLSAIEDLGSMDVFCTDKTGTLTEAKIELERHEDAEQNESERVLELAYINSTFETGLRSPLDEAILAHRHIDVSAWKKIDEVPFDFERRRVSVLVDKEGARLLAVKGAPEDLLGLCVDCEVGGKSVPLDEGRRARLMRRLDELGDQGFRVLAIASKRVAPDQSHAVIGDEAALSFCGFAAFLDPPKESARDALAALARQGIEVKVVTGDNERVTRYICSRLDLPIRGTLTGTEVAKLDDSGLEAAVEANTLFCRMNPGQKDRVILALKRRGHVVGYLGDGVNDAPPLHSSDVGLSVNSAVDVAREAADMILLHHDLRVLADGVSEGRRTYGNIMKYIMMGTSSNFGNMFSMAIASVALPFLPMLPAQILLNNLLYDVSEIPIPADRVDAEDTAKPRAWDMGFIRDFMWAIGPVSSLCDLLTFVILLKVFDAGEALFQTGWFIESLTTQVLVIFVIRTRGNPFASRPAPALVATSLAIVAIGALLPWTPLAGYFGFVAPPPVFYLVVAGMAATYLMLVQGAKSLFYRHHPVP